MDFIVTDEINHHLEMWKGRKHSNMKHGSADWDKRSYGWVKELTENPVRAARSERRVMETAKYLRSRGLLTEDQSVIDIGCGPGRFVVEFAKTARSVTGTDISAQMCAFGKEYAQSQGLSNVNFVPCDFSSASLDEMGWRNAFDLVFSSITPAMSTYEALKKSEEMSRGWCFQSNFIKVTDTLADKVLSEVLPPEMRPVERNLRVFYNLFNVLLLEGKMPETMYFKEEEDEVSPVDDAFINSALKMAPKVTHTEEMIEKVREGFQKYADENGHVSTHREWYYGWVLWHV